MEAAVHEKILDERLAALERARAWSPRVISKLESHIRTADDVALFRINPIRFAAENSIAEAETIDLFLHGAFSGPVRDGLAPALLGLLLRGRELWQPQGGAQSVPLRHVPDRSRGRARRLHRGRLDRLAADRSIAFHRPATLSAQDFAFAYKLTDEGLLPDGTPFVHMLRSWTSAISYLPPGMTRLEVEAKDGLLHAWGLTGMPVSTSGSKGAGHITTNSPHPLHGQPLRAG